MTRLTPVSRTELLRRLRSLGFEGPFVGGKHFFMVGGELRLIVPNPQHSDIGVDLEILAEQKLPVPPPEDHATVVARDTGAVSPAA